MIFKIILNYLLGFINVTIEGFFIERFINNCINKKIFLWGIKRKSGTLVTLNVNVNDFKKMRNICKISKCKIKINSKKGLPFILYKYRKRKLLLLLSIPITLAIIISSRFIWNIEIIGAQNIDKHELILQLEQEGISIGKIKSNIKSTDVIDKIRLKRNDIAWMSLDLKGTNAIITLVESDKKPDIINKEEYCNIVANNNGVITKITADVGTALVKSGNTVEKGDILIGGYMEGKYTDTRYVHAKGIVEAKVWHTKKIKTELTREISNQTGNKKNKYSININNFKINLYKSIPNFENYDTINETKKIKLFSNFYLPIEINKTVYLEKEISNITYGREELKNIVIKELEQQFEKDQMDTKNVTNKIVNIYEPKENTIEIEMTYEVIENISTEEKLK